MSSNDIYVLSARIDGGNLAHGRPVPLPDSPAADDLKKALQIPLTLAFATSLQGGIPAFTDWGKLVVFQGGRRLQLTDSVSSLDALEPVICIVSARSGLPLEPISRMIADNWSEQQKKEKVEEFAKALAPHIAAQIRESRPGIVATSQERHWMPVPAIIALKQFFHSACNEISVRLQSNKRYPEIGLTSELLFNVFERTSGIARVRDVLSPLGMAVSLQSEESGPAETATGSDLGFCLTVKGRGLLTRRAILCQAKRLHPASSGSFSSTSKYGDLLDEHGREQAQKMLRITPCAFFLLYNPEGLASLVGSQSISETSSTLEYGDQGIAVLPAQFVEGASASMWSAVRTLFPFSSSFVKFMVDDFIQGKVGDSRPVAVNAALTRERRAVLDLPHGDVPPPRFSVDLTIEVPNSVDG